MAKRRVLSHACPLCQQLTCPTVMSSWQLPKVIILVSCYSGEATTNVATCKGEYFVLTVRHLGKSQGPAFASRRRGEDVKGNAIIPQLPRLSSKPFQSHLLPKALVLCTETSPHLGNAPASSRVNKEQSLCHPQVSHCFCHPEGRGF